MSPGCLEEVRKKQKELWKKSRERIKAHSYIKVIKANAVAYITASD